MLQKYSITEVKIMAEKNLFKRLFSLLSLSSFYLILTVFLFGTNINIAFSAAFPDEIIGAMIKNDLKKITELLEKNPQLISQKDKYDNNLLHESIKRRKSELVDYFIKKGLDINAKNKNGFTPLALCIENYDMKIFMSLINAGCEVNSSEKLFNWSPLHMAVMNELKDAAEVIINKKANMEAADRYGKTTLHYAKTIDMAEFLISKGADINSAAKNGDTLIHSAASSDSKAMVQFFLDKGFDKDKKNNEGETPLFKAVLHKALNAAELLIAKGANINERTADDGYILPLAVSSDNTGAVSLLLESGANINVKDRFKNSLLHLCRSVEIAELIIEKGANVNERDDMGYAPLHEVRKPELCEFLIKNGADINAQNAQGETPLMHAAKRADIDIVNLLISKKADINLKSAGGECAIHFAVRGFNEEKIENYKLIINALISNGADVNAKANFGDTPIFSAFQPALIKYAIEKGADIKAVDNFGRCALHKAMNAGAAKSLIEKGANIEAKDVNGATPLCNAAAFDKELTEFLISKGANVNAKGYAARNIRRGSMEHLWQAPLLMAVYYRKADIVEFLISKGADIEITGDDGKTALHLAAMDGSINIINLLIKNDVKINVSDRYSNTPLKLALENDKLKAAEILRKYGSL